MLGTTVLVEAKGLSFEIAVFILILAKAVAFTGYLFHSWVGDKLERRNTMLGRFFLGGSSSTIMLLGPNSSGFVNSM